MHGTKRSGNMLLNYIILLVDHVVGWIGYFDLWTISGLKGEIRLVCSSFPGERLLVSTSDLQSQRISHVLSVSVGLGHLTCAIQVVLI